MSSQTRRRNADARGASKAVGCSVPHTITAGFEADLYSLTPWGVMGWARRPSQPSGRVEVEAVLDGIVIARTLAADMRPDVAAAGRDDGRCGFTLGLHGLGIDAEPPSIQLRLGGEVTILSQRAWSRLEGFVDEVTVWGATGWAWAPAAPEATVTVEARGAGGRIIGRAAANQMRHDISSSGRGSGFYGFVLRFDEPAGATGFVTFTAAAPDGAQASLPFAPVSEVVGFVDAMTRQGALGWSWRPETPDEPLDMEAVLHGEVIGRAVADRPLDHLRESGRGTGAYGFTIHYDQRIADNVAPVIQARYGDRVFPLPGLASFEDHEPAPVLLPAEPPTDSALPEGAVDYLTRDSATGWAWDPSHPEKALVIEAVVGERLVGTTQAEQHREDLAYWGKGTGHHGFTLAFTHSLGDGVVPRIFGRTTSGMFELRGAAASMDMGEATASPPAAPEPPAAELAPSEPMGDTRVEGSVDYLSRSGATGWAWRPGAPDAAVTVRAVIGGRVLGSAVANAMRADLAHWGKGSGRYGFTLAFDQWLAGSEAPRFEIEGSADDIGLPAPPLPNETPAPNPARSGAGQFSPLVEGHVDRMTRWEASGWAWLPDDPAASVEIRAMLDGKLIGHAVADELREDLANWGKGTGRYGFHMVFDAPVAGDTPPRLLPYVPAAQPLECALTLPAASTAELYGRPRGTTEMLLADHARFTGPGRAFEEFDNSILDGSAIPEPTPWLIAFYLPQFHAIEANDKFWGKGFTEWRQLPRGVSRYPGHYQPRTPRDLGFYNLLSADTLERQFAVAKAAGVTAFAYYYYWFNGTRVLEKPLDNLLASNADVPFMIIWANENWTRTWDGSESSILLRQDYRRVDDKALAADLARHFADPRYLRLNGRPLFVIYNPGNIPQASKVIARWRKLLRTDHGLDPLIFMAQSFGLRDPRPLGLDGAMEFPPHKLTDELPGRRTPDAYSASFTGRVINYEDFVTASLAEQPQDFALVKTVVPSWDNESRRPNRGLSLEGASPLSYETWLRALFVKAVRHPINGQPIVAVNAWNEWAEGAYLEPDVHFGAAYLNATARARKSAMQLVSPVAKRPRVSVIFPNFNHEAFIVERITAVLNQTVPPDEIIFLDDCSTDGSVALARATLERSEIPFRMVLNEENSGGVFRQWLKGMNLARHELIWIAETDDSVHPDFLLHILPQFEREDVAAAFGRIRYIDVDGTRLDDLDGYFAELNDFDWDRSTVVAAYRAFSRDFAIKNIIPNAAGLVFRKPVLTEAEAARLTEYRFAGDWYCYALILRGGSVAYCRAAESYFRLNRSSASRSAFFTDRHMAEHAMVVSDLFHLYNISPAAILAHATSLSKYLKSRSAEELNALLAAEAAKDGRPHPLRICIAVHSFDIGGGELVPLELANSLRGRGHHITYLAIERPKNTGSNLRRRLRTDIPVVYWQDVEADLGMFLADHGIEVFNSHNVSVDYRLALVGIDVGIPYVASLHGGYETVPGLLTDHFCTYVRREVTRWLYLSAKNLAPLLESGVSEQLTRRSFNTVAEFHDEWVDRAGFRAEHAIADDAFIVVQCSRAIEEKGWGIAVDVVAAVAQQTGRDVRLVLIGEGPAADRLRKVPASRMRHVTLMGQVDTPIRYFRCFDAAIFPSTFSGETFPLFLLEAFMASLPVVSTDIGEIGHIMGAQASKRPGATVPHAASRRAIVADMITELAQLVENGRTYERMRRNAKQTSARYSASALADFYVDEFRQQCEIKRRGQAQGQEINV